MILKKIRINILNEISQLKVFDTTESVSQNIVPLKMH